MSTIGHETDVFLGFSLLDLSFNFQLSRNTISLLGLLLLT